MAMMNDSDLEAFYNSMALSDEDDDKIVHGDAEVDGGSTGVGYNGLVKPSVNFSGCSGSGGIATQSMNVHVEAMKVMHEGALEVKLKSPTKVFKHGLKEIYGSHISSSDNLHEVLVTSVHFDCMMEELSDGDDRSPGLMDGFPKALSKISLVDMGFEGARKSVINTMMLYGSYHRPLLNHLLLDFEARKQPRVLLDDKNFVFFHQNDTYQKKKNLILGIFDSSMLWVEEPRGESAFIPSRLITDNAMIGSACLNVIKCHKNGKEGFLAYKADIAKTYDRVDWNFSRDMMGHSSIIKRKIGQNTIAGLVCGRRSLMISHQLFAKDIFLFLEATQESCIRFWEILLLYEDASSQLVNLDESTVMKGFYYLNGNVIEVGRLIGLCFFGKVFCGGRDLWKERIRWLVDNGKSIHNQTDAWISKNHVGRAYSFHGGPELQLVSDLKFMFDHWNVPYEWVSELRFEVGMGAHFALIWAFMLVELLMVPHHPTQALSRCSNHLGPIAQVKTTMAAGGLSSSPSENLGMSDFNLFVDASINEEQMNVGLGVTVVRCEGKVLCSSASPTTISFSPHVVEATTILPCVDDWGAIPPPFFLIISVLFKLSIGNTCVRLNLVL
uniref:Reverse transcriptase domain-containing protein n=1 Tax=Cannabis sativa TaxID=3483 RepID=A0A803Q9K7_CANSA